MNLNSVMLIKKFKVCLHSSPLFVKKKMLIWNYDAKKKITYP